MENKRINSASAGCMKRNSYPNLGEMSLFCPLEIPLLFPRTSNKSFIDKTQAWTKPVRSSCCRYWPRCCCCSFLSYRPRGYVSGLVRSVSPVHNNNFIYYCNWAVSKLNLNESMFAIRKNYMNWIHLTWVSPRKRYRLIAAGSIDNNL